ncbi:MAG: hypothetical protein GY810_24260 [Aureispira sp.]|nr:hypothetical protein [Aureispira sp.]
MKQIKLILVFLLFYTFGYSQQPLKMRGNASGLFSLGMRSTLSLFNNHNWNSVGIGTGGQFRLQFFDQVNSEWYLDYTTNDIEGKAHRDDMHIGWSVFFYPVPGNIDFSKVVKPFIETGHCFDFSWLAENQNPQNKMFNFTSAIQLGLGTHFNLTQRFDLTLKTQYMMHLGGDLHAHLEGDEVHIERHKGFSAEGHLFITVSANYKIADLWGKRNK